MIFRELGGVLGENQLVEPNVTLLQYAVKIKISVLTNVTQQQSGVLIIISVWTNVTLQQSGVLIIILV